MLAVLAPGPSSKVRATVLPLPGAASLGPVRRRGAAGRHLRRGDLRRRGHLAVGHQGGRARRALASRWRRGGGGRREHRERSGHTQSDCRGEKPHRRGRHGNLPTGPGRREHGRSLMKLNNQVQSIKRAGKSPGPCGLTTRDLWQALSPVPSSRSRAPEHRLDCSREPRKFRPQETATTDCQRCWLPLRRLPERASRLIRDCRGTARSRRPGARRCPMPPRPGGQGRPIVAACAISSESGGARSTPSGLSR